MRRKDERKVIREISTFVDVLKSLSNSTRLRIMRCLKENPEGLCPTVLSEWLSIRPSVISRHLKILQDAGLLWVETSGRMKIYSCDWDELDDVLTELSEYIRYRRTDI